MATGLLSLWSPASVAWMVAGAMGAATVLPAAAMPPVAPAVQDGPTVATALPAVVDFAPQGEAVALDAAIWLQFDRDVDAARLAAQVQVRVDEALVGTRALTRADVLARPELAPRLLGLERHGGGRRWLSLAPLQPWPREAVIQVGLPVQLRPRVAQRGPKLQQLAFRTHGTLRVVASRCGWGDACRARQPWAIAFSTPLDMQSLQRAAVRIEPPLSDAKLEVHGAELRIAADSLASTRYTVHLPAGLRDIYGQALQQPVEVPFGTVAAAPRLVVAGPETLVLPPGQGLPLETVNLPAVRVRMWRMQPQDWWTWSAAPHGGSTDAPAVPLEPADKPVSEQLVRLTEGDLPVRTLLSLTAVLGSGPGHAVVRVESRSEDGQLQHWQERWVQVSGLAVTAVADDLGMQVEVRYLRDGQATPAAAVVLLDRSGASWHSGATSDCGTLWLDLGHIPRQRLGSRQAMLLARSGDDAVFVVQPLVDSTPPARLGPASRLWHLILDRPRYLRGDTVHVHGWLRRRGAALEPQRWQGIGTVYWQLVDDGRQPLARGEAEVGEDGGLGWQFAVPWQTPVGALRVQVGLQPGLVEYSAGLTVSDASTVAADERGAPVADTLGPAPQEVAVEVIADREGYQPGQLARILLVAPWPAASGEVTFSQDSRIYRQSVQLQGRSAWISLPLTEAHAPGLHVHAALSVPLRSRPADGLPVWASGSAYLAVAPRAHTLAVTLEPRTRASGPAGGVDITVRDAHGRPVGGATVVLVLRTPDSGRVPVLLDALHPPPSPTVRLWETRSLVPPSELAPTAVAAPQERSPAARSDHRPGEARIPSGRRELLHAPFAQVRTSADGRARVSLPEARAGPLQVTAIADDGAAASGSAELVIAPVAAPQPP